MKLTSLLIFFLLLSKNVFAEKIFNAKSFELRNGLKVIVIENKRAPVVAQMIWYNFVQVLRKKKRVLPFYGTFNV